MNTVNNQVHKNTEKNLRAALISFMEEEKVPSVREICEKAGINRSTFYRHYGDVYDLMEKVEKEIQKGLLDTLRGDSPFLDRLETSSAALVPLIAYMGENRHFYRVYLRRQDRVPLEESFRLFWTERIVPLFRRRGIWSESHMRYYFEYVKAGFIMVMCCWLEGGCRESPEEMAGILYKMLPARN